MRNRVLAAEAYFEAVEDFEVRDIEAGRRIINAGKLPGYGGAFAPTPPQVASAVRIAMNARLDDENRYRQAHPRLPPPDVVKDEGTRLRVKALATATLASLSDAIGAESDAKRKERTERQERFDQRFEPDMSARETAKRLGLPYRGYDVGDPEGDEDAA